MIKPSLEEFKSHAKPGSIIPVYREFLADMETPVSLFKKLDAESEQAFFLESVEQGEQLGRYSFLGADPAIIFRVKGKDQEIISKDSSLKPQETPIATLRYLLNRYKAVTLPDMPPFLGGAVGYMAYDTVRYYEDIPDECKDDLDLPDSLIMIAETLVAFDHVKHRMILIANAHLDGENSVEETYQGACDQLEALRAKLQRNVSGDRLSLPGSKEKKSDSKKGLEAFNDLSIPVYSNFKKEEFEEVVEKAKDYITAGDIFQVVLSQRFDTEVSCHPFDIYRALRAVNPSPYMFYLKCGDDFQLAGSSPEILSKLQGGKVTVRPIAGTRRRGHTHEEDLALEKDLLDDEKEIAEHVMLVDLGRNDIGRVSKFGTVRVDDFKIIERYSHVMHIVSNVVGDIQEGKDGFDVLAATFPAGTLSGAPKIRAMEIIDELEKNKRGPYGGSVVYLSFHGEMDSCITIRTAVIKGNKVYVQAGAGIVADSEPEKEYKECVNKARGMLKAIELAEKGLD